VIDTIKRLLRDMTPRYRLTQSKRRLEAVLREHGINRREAARITNHYFMKGNRHDH